jgi:hypothetical protein
MDAVFELNGLASGGWFDQLAQNLPEMGGVAPGDLFEIRPPAGTMGAAWTPKFKARLETAAQIAAVLSATVALYPAGFGGSTNQCRLTFADSSTHVEVVVPCDEADSPKFVTTIEGVVAKLREPPSSITVDPVIAPLEKSAPSVGQP